MTLAVVTTSRRGTARRPPLPQPVVSNARLAMAILVAGETMLFAGLIGSYLVFRLAAPTWPPPDQPRLPLGLTTLNTAVLVASLAPLLRELRAAARDPGGSVGGGVRLAAGAGALFLAIQGIEWARLVRHGLTLGAGPYGGTFYVLIGCHALHVSVAVMWLVVVAWAVGRPALRPARRYAVLEPCAVYWAYVVALWLVLFPLVYLL